MANRFGKRRFVARAFWPLAGAAFCLAGCGADHCPEGRVEVNGRCVAPALDGGVGDAGPDGTTGNIVGDEGSSSSSNGGGSSSSGNGSSGSGNSSTGGNGSANGGDSTCPSGFADCNGQADDGCETNVLEDEEHCGACDSSCSSAGATSVSCVEGSCQPTCDDGFADCVTPEAGAADDGCETSITDDVDHCGACDRSCATDGAEEVACEEGLCIPTCTAGRGDCVTPSADEPDDGCETNLETDATHCGACGFTCSNTSATAVACIGGSCKPECAAGFEDCTSPAPDQGADDGCETDVTDPENCGACGKSCDGGACESQLCGPVVLAEVSTPSEYPAVDTSSSLALDDESVYFVHCTNGGSVNRVAKSGGNIDVLAPNETFPTGVAVDISHVWWTDQKSEIGRVRRRRIGSTSITNFYEPSGMPFFPAAIDVDETHVAWGNLLDDTVISSSKSFYSLTTRSTSSPRAVALAGSRVYWATGAGTVYRSPLDSTSPSLVDDSDATDLSAHDSVVYWDTGSNIQRMRDDQSQSVTVVQEDARRLAANGDDLYFADSSNKIKHAVIPDPVRATTAEERASAGTVIDMVADENSVYWAENTSTRLRIMKMVK